MAWSTQALQLSTWTTSGGDFAHLWSAWGTSTWGALHSSGRTWSFLAGLTFTVNSTTVTSWVIQATAT